MRCGAPVAHQRYMGADAAADGPGGTIGPLDTRPQLEVRGGSGGVENGESRAGPAEDALTVVGDIPGEPLGFQRRADLLAALDAAGRSSRLVVVHTVTGMRGAGKTHLAGAYARTRLAQRWRLVAWVNARDIVGVLAGLAAVAAGLGLGVGEQDADAAGRAVRDRLEIDGDRCLLVFDNATDFELLLPFIPSAGAARVIITSSLQPVAGLGSAVPVDVFSEPEALAFLAERTGRADTKGARAVAAELGFLPLALAQAAAVIADQHLEYGTYLDRLRGMPVGDWLRPVETSPYPRGVAAAVLLSLDRVRAGDDSGTCIAVMELLAVLSPAGVRRNLVHAAARQGALARDWQAGALLPEVLDKALAVLAEASLLTFSMDGTSVSAHYLVMRVIRERLAARNSLIAVCATAAELLDELAESLRQTWHQNRAAVRDLVEQITALCESSAGCPTDEDLTHCLIRLRWWAVSFLLYLDDSAAQSILIAEPLLADQERVLGADYPGILDTRDNLATAYQDAGHIAKAITLYEQNLAARERVLGADHPGTLDTRDNLATAYQDAGHIAKAITLYEQNLAARERVLGADHPDTLDTRDNLAAQVLPSGARPGKNNAGSGKNLDDWRVCIAFGDLPRQPKSGLQALIQSCRLVLIPALGSRLGDQVAVSSSKTQIFLYAPSIGSADEAAQVAREVLARHDVSAPIRTERWSRRNRSGGMRTRCPPMSLPSGRLCTKNPQSRCAALTQVVGVSSQCRGIRMDAASLSQLKEPMPGSMTFPGNYPGNEWQSKVALGSPRFLMWRSARTAPGWPPAAPTRAPGSGTRPAGRSCSKSATTSGLRRWRSARTAPAWPPAAPTRAPGSGTRPAGRSCSKSATTSGYEAVAFSPDGTRLATGSSDKSARVWDAASGQKLLEVRHDKWVEAVAFSPDGTRLATGSSDKSARVWDAASGQKLLEVRQDDWVRAVAFSPDGARLATGGDDKSARVWDAASGRELLEVRHGNWIRAVAFSPDGTRLATGSRDRSVRIWSVAEL